MATRKRRTSSFLIAEVLGRLRRIEPPEHYLTAGHVVIDDSLAVRKGERVLIVFEAGFDELAAALAMAVDEAGAQVDAISIGDPLPPRVEEKIARHLAPAQVSVLIANVTFPRAIRTPLVENTEGRRHAHMLGISDAVVRQSLRVDYRAVSRRGEELIALVEPAAEIRVESARGPICARGRSRAAAGTTRGGSSTSPAGPTSPPVRS